MVVLDAKTTTHFHLLLGSITWHSGGNGANPVAGTWTPTQCPSYSTTSFILTNFFFFHIDGLKQQVTDFKCTINARQWLHHAQALLLSVAQGLGGGRGGEVTSRLGIGNPPPTQGLRVQLSTQPFLMDTLPKKSSVPGPQASPPRVPAYKTNQ